MKANIEDLKKIKLIIWDLDETFWIGTLSDNSEGSKITPIQSNIELIKLLTDRGIVNAVCSKNNREDAENELTKLGILDYFVFNSINWEPKGHRIKALISDMSLRPANVLFIDDNTSNLNEVEFVCPDIYTALPEFISSIYQCVNELGKDDKTHSRLKQYKILETKRKDEASSSSNLEFLESSDIKVYIKTNNLQEDSERIEELIQRSNQLNYTKKRTPLNELIQILGNVSYNCGSVYVRDRYGVYGMVGFYAIKDNTCEHFLFSCRTMGMGIEQFVYSWLGCPSLTTIGDVSGNITNDDNLPHYIHLVDSLDSFSVVKECKNKNLQILLKGPCDLEVMRTYLQDGDYDITAEFNFVDERGNQADFYNHTTQIVNSLNSRDKIEEICNDYHFISASTFETSIFSRPYDIICLSPLMDATLSMYKRSTDGFVLPFGLYNCPLTDIKNWDSYINKQVMTAHCSFSKQELVKFSNSFSHQKYDARITCNNLQCIINEARKLNSNVKIVIMLLPELEFQYNDIKDVNNFKGKEIVHKQINDLLRKKFSDDDSIYLLDINKYVKTQNDYFDSINHFSKIVYYKLADEFSKYANSLGYNVKTKSFIKALLRNKVRNFYKKHILNTGKLENIVQAINRFLRGRN